MGLVVSLTVGRTLARNEKLTTAKLNAIVKGIVINISGSVGTSDLVDGSVTPIKMANGAFWYAQAASSGATYVATYDVPVTTYVDGMWLSFKADALSKQSQQFDAGPGAKPIVKFGGQVLGAGDIPANSIVTVRYNSTLVVGGCWEIMSLVGEDPFRDDFAAASATMGGQRGLVPAPKCGSTRLWLRDDGWQDLTATITAIVQAQQSSAINVAQFLLTQH